MPFFTAHSTNPDTAVALRAIIDRVRSGWQGDADLALLFWSPHHRETIALMAAALLDEVPARCVLGCEAVPTGAVSVLLQGDLGYRAIVSQGCRPLGKPMVITKAEQSVILELGGKTPMQQLQDLWLTMTPHDHELVQRGLMIGRA